MSHLRAPGCPQANEVSDIGRTSLVGRFRLRGESGQLTEVKTSGSGLRRLVAHLHPFSAPRRGGSCKGDSIVGEKKETRKGLTTSYDRIIKARLQPYYKDVAAGLLGSGPSFP